MKKVSYQKEKIDQLTHEYKYDELNRLVDVMSSIDDIHYHREASYSYYDYGPLARKEIGSARVQGQDFTYTLNGWLKGMNSNTLDKTKDPGKDGAVYPSGLFAARNERVAKDVVGFSLGYYGGDYSPIGGNPAEAAYAGTAFGNGADDLFNGNIRHMVTAIEGLDIQGYAYRYDQLQRIKQMQVYRASDVQSLFAWTNSASTDEYKTTFTYDRNGNLLSLDRNGIGSELDMDRFVYNYHTLGGQPSNRLNYVVDNGTDYSSYEDIKSGQATGNYTYNKIGELIEDASEDMILHWRTGDHKLSKIERNDQDSPQIEFHYNPFGQRALKVEKPRISSVIQSASNWKYTYYSYDANGQVMAVYTGNFQGSSEQVKLSEQHLYGAERLGMMTRNVVMFDNGVTSYTHKEEDVVHEDERGYKRYELHGHTNSVLAVISDRKMYNSVDGNYEPVMISWADYYAFGMLQSGRHGSATSELYRYGCTGMESDVEIKGQGNSYNFGARIYDPRLGRWFTRDPHEVFYPSHNPYNYVLNNPLLFKDVDGRDAIITITEENGKTVITISSNVYLMGKTLSDKYYEELAIVWARVFGKDYDVNIDGKEYILRFDVKYVRTDTKDGFDKSPRVIQDYSKGDPAKKQSMKSLSMLKSKGDLKSSDLNNNGTILPFGDNYLIFDFFEGNSVADVVNNKGLIKIYRDPSQQVYATIHELLHLFGLSDRYNSYKDENGEQINENHEGYDWSVMSLYSKFKGDFGYGLQDNQAQHIVEGVLKYIVNNLNYLIPNSVNQYYLQRFLWQGVPNGNGSDDRDRNLDDVDQNKSRPRID